MLPSWRSRWVHMPVSRGSRYLYWASSTCRRPSRVLARWAKMSRIRPLRSMTDTPVIFSRARCWEGERSLSKITRLAPVVSSSSFTSSTLPSPIKLWGSGAGRFCSTLATHWPPAVSSRASSSSRVCSVAFSSREKIPALSPTSTAFSMTVFCKSSIFSPNYSPKMKNARTNSVRAQAITSGRISC